MKIINDYIIKESKMPILFGISLFTFIFLIEIIISMMENIIVRGISVIDVLRMLSFYIPIILSQTIPMGVFLGMMITFGSFNKNNEITAMNAMGISLNKILKPALTIGVIGTMFIFFLQESLMPRSFIKLQQLSYKMIYENPVFQLKDKVLIDNLDEYKIYINSTDRKTKDAKDVLIISNEESSKYPILVLSKSANWESAALELNDATLYKFNDDGEMDLTGNFEKKRIPMTEYFKDMKVQVKDIEGMSVAQLIKEGKSRENIEAVPYIVEMNKKLAIPLSTIMFSVLGVLLSIGNARSGKGINFALGIVVIFLYIVLLNMGMVLAYRSIVSPYTGVWVPNVMLGIFTYFTYKRKARLV